MPLSLEQMKRTRRVWEETVQLCQIEAAKVQGDHRHPEEIPEYQEWMRAAESARQSGRDLFDKIEAITGDGLEAPETPYERWPGSEAA